MTDAYEALDSLRAVLHAEREDLKERLANGLEKDDDYRTCVGRCKALKSAVGKIAEQIKSLNGGTGNDEVEFKRATSGPPKYA